MVDIRNLHFSYERTNVFNGLSLSLQPGHIYGLLGKNGTGKSTLLRNIAGLLAPANGRIEILQFTPAERKTAFLQQVFFLPEDIWLPPLPLEKWLRNTHPFYPNFSHAQFEKNAEAFEIPRTKRLDELSYGQQKKALIAFALAANPLLLLMDEPTNGLDIISKSQFRKIIAGSLDEGKCILISTHQVRDLENLIDEVIILDEGKILFNQPMENIARKLEFRFSFQREIPQDTIYGETVLQGTALVLPNTEGHESRLDLEMLYKALLLNGEKLNKIFTDKTPTHHEHKF